jgi:hypothetical protein
MESLFKNGTEQVLRDTVLFGTYYEYEKPKVTLKHMRQLSVPHRQTAVSPAHGRIIQESTSYRDLHDSWKNRKRSSATSNGLTTRNYYKYFEYGLHITLIFRRTSFSVKQRTMPTEQNMKQW